MQTTIDAAALTSALAHFTRSEELFRHPLRRVRFTQGVEYLAKQAGAYWLIDAIASHQSARLDARAGGFQVWTLTVTDGEAVLECKADSTGPALARQRIEYTDFPLASIRLYVAGDGADRVLMLPSEY